VVTPSDVVPLQECSEASGNVGTTLENMLHPCLTLDFPRR